ncbi:MAG TPA: indole-3-glycerol phosphate synthase TrpC [Polyangiaceae bacterium]|jgi:indole-3-glycerol phosphate synthase|nr:indole-3-glycerol phosphate synthase TrpC [Polyangiaceae bacterium]
MSSDRTGQLARILAVKAEEVAELRARSLPAGPGPRSFSLRKANQKIKLISEIKFRSPSAGPLSTELSVAERARAYERGGADMISVLCDERFFDGAFSHLSEARAATSLPLLCKEFVIDEVQLDAAAAYGADAILIIVRCVPPARLARLVREARARGLAPFVEIAADEEAKLALDAGATLIGVNARDLDTLEMDAARTARVLASLPSDVTRVHLSGIRTAADVRNVAMSPADAALIGETLMRQAEPEALLRSFVTAASG